MFKTFQEKQRVQSSQNQHIRGKKEKTPKVFNYEKHNPNILNSKRSPRLHGHHSSQTDRLQVQGRISGIKKYQSKVKGGKYKIGDQDELIQQIIRKYRKPEVSSNRSNPKDLRIFGNNQYREKKQDYYLVRDLHPNNTYTNPSNHMQNKTANSLV